MPHASRQFDRMAILIGLGKVYDALYEKHSAELRAIGNRNVMGGGEWLDLFIRMEGIRGLQTALRSGNTLEYSIKFGKSTSSIAVKIWNTRREYQVHRWEETTWDFIDTTVRKLLNASS